VAVIVAIWLPRGIWGTLTARLHFEFFPVGYFVASERTRRRGRPAATAAAADASTPTATE
jgi:hypothetical protein